jgi:hypothetical protein
MEVWYGMHALWTRLLPDERKLLKTTNEHLPDDTRRRRMRARKKMMLDAVVEPKEMKLSCRMPAQDLETVYVVHGSGHIGCSAFGNDPK